MNSGGRDLLSAIHNAVRNFGPDDSLLPLFDATGIHARKAAEWALAKR